ncbi:MAG TPA: hypothetical protein VNI84_16625, partial [Pyrinomonadaceae bacterium]|nr:hypothetical protein [Pyrinomonadaceae bacterium]
EQVFDKLRQRAHQPLTEVHVVNGLHPDLPFEYYLDMLRGLRAIRPGMEDNLNPIGRAFYSASTLLCTPASLSQEVGLALGAQAGEARIKDVITKSGFSHFRRATETPFNLVYEAKP